MNTKAVRAQMLDLLRRRDVLEGKLQNIDQRIAFLQACAGRVGQRAFDDHMHARFRSIETGLKRLLLKHGI